MSTTEEDTQQLKLRVWPVAVILAIQIATLILTVTDSIQNLVRFIFMMAGPMACVVLFLCWWLFASRASWQEKFKTLAIVGILLGLVAVSVHSTVGVIIWIYGAPLGIFAMALAVWICRADSPRRRSMLVTACVFVAWAWFPLVRVTGFDGAYFPELTWRWTPTQAALLADRAGSLTATDESAGPGVDLPSPEWPTFRGPAGNSRVPGLNLAADWSKLAPREVWRNEIGPGWSSFAVSGNRLYTQEQRGEFEMTVCYDTETGREIWRYGVESQFDEVVSGTGPRATPTIAGTRLLSYGAKGILSCLDVWTGELLWQHDLMQEFEGKLPMWGYSGSPMVHNDLCVAFAGGTGGNGLIAFSIADGEVQWQQPAAGMNFSTPVVDRFGESDQLLFQTSEGLVAMDPLTGGELWKITPDNWQGPSMVQPQKISESSLIVPLGDGIGVARIEIRQGGSGFEVTEAWNSRDLKPSFNDFVYHDGYLYGFDQNIFACVSAETGERQWKRGRYGFGQVLLIEDSEHLLIQTEPGDIVILEATPEAHRELARLEALSDKTWNHPVVVDNSLFARNGREAVHYELPVRSPE